MNQHKNFTRKSFLQRFLISQIILVAFVTSVFTIANQQTRPKLKTDADKLASKKKWAGINTPFVK